MAEIVPNPNETWRNFSKKASIAACKLNSTDFKRLYRLVNEKQIEVGRRVLGGFFQTEQETAEQFKERYERTKNAFIRTVTMTSANGEDVMGHGEAFFDSGLLSGRIESILYDTSFSPKAQLNFMPPDRATVLLDFSRPSLLNFNTEPSKPTPNNSNWFVTGQTESWSTSVSARLSDFFAERSTSVNWLHQAATYDALLFVVGFPVSLWWSYRIGNSITAGRGLPSALNTSSFRLT